MNRKMSVKKQIIILFCMAMSCIWLMGCDKKKSGESKEPSITDSWKVIEMTVSGKSIKDPDALAVDGAPEFTCSDGTNFTLTYGGSVRKGTLSETEDGVYVMKIDGSNANVQATISGDILTIDIEGGKGILRFERE